MQKSPDNRGEALHAHARSLWPNRLHSHLMTRNDRTLDVTASRILLDDVDDWCIITTDRGSSQSNHGLVTNGSRSTRGALKRSSVKLEHNMESNVSRDSEGYSETATPNARMFDGAHDFVVHNPTFIYKLEKPRLDPIMVEKFLQNLDSGGAVLAILERKRMAGVEVDSSEREYAPRCHPETRKEMRIKLEAWLSNPQRHWSFVWMSGPAGAGKSAIAQTFAEHCQALGQLGATFFFSKLQGRDSSHGLVATIAYQLADRHAGYNYLISRILYRNPSILDKTLRIQFQKLIVEPFTTLANEHAASGKSTLKPLVVIIDGLDECSDECAQCEIIRLIGEFIRRTNHILPSLLWLLCSRPEWHLKREFAYADPPITCGREEITCNAVNDINDVYCILKDGLQAIRNKSSWTLIPSQTSLRWPAEHQLRRLSSKVGGLPVLASTVLRFIGDGSGSPDTLLEICLLFLEDTGAARNLNPLAALDTFYRRIMMRVPKPVLPVTKQILASFIVSTHYETLHAFDLALFLQVTKDTFYSSLQHLHSVIDVPPSEHAHERPLHFFHKSFEDFLVDPTRSKSFTPDMEGARFELAKLTLRWYNHILQEQCQLPSCPHPSSDESDNPSRRLTEDLTASQRTAFYQRFGNFIKYHWGTICANVNGRFSSEMAVELSKFNFCHFDLIECMDPKQKQGFVGFLRKWYPQELKQKDGRFQEPLIRFKPLSEIDVTLAKASPVPLPPHESSPFEILAGSASQFSFYFSSLHRSRKFYQKPAKKNVLAGFWIGRRKQSTLVLVVKRV